MVVTLVSNASLSNDDYAVEIINVIYPIWMDAIRLDAMDDNFGNK